jgi:hypothetical protein
LAAEFAVVHRNDLPQFITRFNWEQGAAFGFLLLARFRPNCLVRPQATGQRFADMLPLGLWYRAGRSSYAVAAYVAAFFAIPVHSLPLAVVALCSRSTTPAIGAPWRGFTSTGSSAMRPAIARALRRIARCCPRSGRACRRGMGDGAPLGSAR